MRLLPHLCFRAPPSTARPSPDHRAAAPTGQAPSRQEPRPHVTTDSPHSQTNAIAKKRKEKEKGQKRKTGGKGLKKKNKTLGKIELHCSALATQLGTIGLFLGIRSPRSGIKKQKLHFKKKKKEAKTAAFGPSLLGPMGPGTRRSPAPLTDSMAGRARATSAARKPSGRPAADPDPDEGRALAGAHPAPANPSEKGGPLPGLGRLGSRLPPRTGRVPSARRGQRVRGSARAAPAPGRPLGRQAAAPRRQLPRAPWRGRDRRRAGLPRPPRDPSPRPAPPCGAE